MSYMIPYDDDPRDRRMAPGDQGRGTIDVNPYIEPVMVVAGAGAGCGLEALKVVVGLLGTTGGLALCVLLILATQGYLPRPDQIGFALNAAADKPAQIADDFTRVGLDATATVTILDNQATAAANAQTIVQAAAEATVEAMRIQTNKDRVAAGLPPLPDEAYNGVSQSQATPLPSSSTSNDPAEKAFEYATEVHQCPPGTIRVGVTRKYEGAGWKVDYNSDDLARTGLNSDDVPKVTDYVTRGGVFTDLTTGITNMNAISAACPVSP